VLPGHGDPISGDEAMEVLTETSRALRWLHDAVLDRLNRGRWPDEIVDEMIQLPPDLAAKPYLRPLYGCPEFVIRDVLRAYAGWWGGDPADLMPVPRKTVAQDILQLMEREAVVARARELAAQGEHRRALHLAMLLEHADPERENTRSLTVEILEALVTEEPSFIARNFDLAAANQRKT
jgi:alkyl sulfatase BDS1-like metallo-beta-lactamase superfamily hydrolase